MRLPFDAPSLGVLLFALAASTPAIADTIIVGTPAESDTGYSIPFGNNYDSQGDGQYQQVYTNSLFSGPITITGLEFFNTEFNSGATAMNTGTFTISLSTTTADWDTLSTTPANNIGAGETQVFSGSLAQPWAFGDTLTIDFSTPFTYTPGPGANLLMNIVATGTGDAGGIIAFDFNGTVADPDGIFGQYRNETSLGGNQVLSGGGLVTGFTTESTPEPGTMVLFSSALIGLLIARARARVAK